jgi:LmbE family N-acetylglucosaminyl deacetylase
MMSPSSSARLVVLAAAAHPDDIEFMMAGTLLLFRKAGAEIHMWNLANGSCGTATHTRKEIIRIRRAEAEASARLAGAHYHPPLFDDLHLFFDAPSLEQVAAGVREIQPTVILTHSLQDYMEDHQNTARLIVTAAFARGMRNFPTRPARPPYEAPVALYHALPHGLRDPYNRPVRPDLFINIQSVLPLKRAMLACHTSQKEWLDVSQGMDAYLTEMEQMAAAVGRLSGRFDMAEGWRLHNPLGLAPEDHHPLEQWLKEFCYAPPPE